MAHKYLGLSRQTLWSFDCFSSWNREKSNRVRTGHGKPGKSWNFRISFSRLGKSWKLSICHRKSWKMKFIVQNKFSSCPFPEWKENWCVISLIYFAFFANKRLNLGHGNCLKIMEKVLEGHDKWSDDQLKWVKRRNVEVVFTRKKKFRVLPTGVEPINFQVPVFSE